jgi:protoheme IX farnesyltransferase
VLFTAGVGVWLAPERPGAAATILFLLGTALLVAAANTLNCWWERDTDARMVRTRQRTLPAGRLDARIALAAGLVEGCVAVALIAAVTSPLTAALGAAALAIYVLLYTPLKRKCWWSVLVGAVPGATPPLMGWTAATGQLSAPGWFLFAILFFWQLPHFVAISLYLKDDYDRGGLRVLPLVHGDRIASRHLCAAATSVPTPRCWCWSASARSPSALPDRATPQPPRPSARASSRSRPRGCGRESASSGRAARSPTPWSICPPSSQHCSWTPADTGLPGRSHRLPLP